MIEYALLCQTIADWRAGRRPVLPSPSPSPSATPTHVAAGGTAPIDVGSLGGEDEDAEVLEAGEADIDDEGYPPAELEADVPVEDEFAAAESAPPPDYDSTMVYGAGGAMPGQWPAEGDPAADAPASDEHEPPRS